MTAPPPVATLLTARHLEQVPADHPSSELRLARAEEKLGAARKIAATDVEIAYDAMRIAVTARMTSPAESTDSRILTCSLVN